MFSVAQKPGVGSMEEAQGVEKLWSSETLGRGVALLAGQPFGLLSMATQDDDLRKKFVETQRFTKPSCFFLCESNMERIPSKGFQKTDP